MREPMLIAGRATLLLALFVWGGPAVMAALLTELPATDAPRAGHAPPVLSSSACRRVMAVARSAVNAGLTGQQAADAQSGPDASDDVVCPAAVTVRRGGAVLAVGWSPAQRVDNAVREAATAAAAEVIARAGDAGVPEPGLLRLEIELLGPADRVGDGQQDLSEVAIHFDPGIHGVAVRYGAGEAIRRPSELVPLDLYCDPLAAQDPCDRYIKTIKALVDELSRQDASIWNEGERVALLRFRTLHLYEPVPGGEPVALVCGLRWLSPEQVTRPAADQFLKEVASFVCYRQKAEGLYAYEYLPGHGLYRPDEQNWIRQAATTWALALYARQSGDDRARQASGLALGAFERLLKPMNGRRGAMFVATPDGEHALGTSALLALAMMDSPDAGRYQMSRLALLEGMVGMQLTNGSFMTNYFPSRSRASQDYYPGEALLALARQYVDSVNPKWRAVCDKALPYYRDYWKRHQSPAFVPWQVQAWSELAVATHLERYADFVFEMSDTIADRQVRSLESDLPLYDGAFDVYGGGRGGVSSAVYLEGFNAALRTAETMGDAVRADRYRAVIRRATRFVMQLQFRQEETYYVAAPGEVVGAIRNSPSDPSLRVDHLQHGLAGVLGALPALPETAEPASQPAGATRQTSAPAASLPAE